MPSWTKYVAKFLTSVAGVVAIAVTQGLLAGAAAKWAAIITGAITAAGVWLVPNAPAPVVPPVLPPPTPRAPAPPR